LFRFVRREPSPQRGGALLNHKQAKRSRNLTALLRRVTTTIQSVPRQDIRPSGTAWSFCQGVEHAFKDIANAVSDRVAQSQCNFYRQTPTPSLPVRHWKKKTHEAKQSQRPL